MIKLIFNLAIVSLFTLILTGCDEDKMTSATSIKDGNTAGVSAKLIDQNSLPFPEPSSASVPAKP